MQPIPAGLIGATGYTGEVLLRLLLAHPHVQLQCVASRSHAGEAIEAVLPRLVGRAGGRTFTASDPQALAANDGVAVWFLALPHGAAAAYALPLVEAGRCVFDLSADFRLDVADTYARHYGQPHPAPDWLSKTPYVVPELAAQGWERAPLIACPGCYPTSILLPLVPLLRAGLIEAGGIVINALSGVSGAGKKESLLYSFGERSESVTAYGAPLHRHVAEIEQELAKAAGADVTVQFTPHLMPVLRGIHTTLVTKARAPLAEVYAAWEAVYNDAPFVHLLPPGQFPDTRQVTHGNHALLSAVEDPRTGNLVLTSVLDNLLKGAGGQAVQLFNRRFGFPEEAGLG